MVAMDCNDIKSHMTEFVTTDSSDFKKSIGKKKWSDFHKHMSCCKCCRDSFKAVYDEWNLKNE